VMEELPRTPLGKVDREALKRAFTQEAP